MERLEVSGDRQKNDAWSQASEREWLAGKYS